MKSALGISIVIYMIMLISLCLVSISVLSYNTSAQLQNLSSTQPLTLLDDNFDSENNHKGAFDYSHFKNWLPLNGTVDLIGNSFLGGNLLPMHGLYIDLDGSSGVPGTLASKKLFRFQPGEYILQFDLAGSQGGFGKTDKNPDTVMASLGKLYQERFTLAWDTPIKTIIRHISVSQPTDARLAFDHLTDGDNRGLLVDNVKLYRVQGNLTK